uniref:Uncharacterized protein n=1 Tax=Sphaerodactylus townsendi TaxID=933632 RepID=A0ACB8F6Q4_9SAUR
MPQLACWPDKPSQAATSAPQASCLTPLVKEIATEILETWIAGIEISLGNLCQKMQEIIKSNMNLSAASIKVPVKEAIWLPEALWLRREHQWQAAVNPPIK